MVKHIGSLLKVKYIELPKYVKEQRKAKRNVDDFNIIYISILFEIGYNSEGRKSRTISWTAHSHNHPAL